ncbi:MAG: 16S rRNA (guanine(527)-N(7))-methyltransferase RsmG [Bacilli bacterium]
MNFKEMQSLLLEKGIKVTDEMIDNFQKYLALLMEWNQKINLTALKTEEEIIEKHFYDSLLMAEEIKFDDQSLLDVGTGAGFPGIPLKIVFEDLFVTLLEPTLKRVNFLDIVIKELGLKKIVTINKRAEDYVKDARSYYDLVTARAVSRLNMLLELCMPLVKVDGLFLAMKGSKGEEEIQESVNALKILNGEIIKIQKTKLVTDNDDRMNIIIKKTNEINMKYPRAYGQIKKSPL